MQIFKKAHREDKELWLALLDQQTTPTESVNSSPLRRLMSHRTHTVLPVSANLLYPRVEEGVKEKLKAKRQTAKGYYDRSAKVLPELEIGQEVRIAGQRNKIWEPGTFVQELSDRSYLVEVNGNTLCQNREALRPKKDTQVTGETTVAETKPPTPVPAQTEGQTALKSTSHSVVTTPVKVNNTQQQNLSGPLKSTHNRIVKAPVRFQDYV